MTIEQVTYILDKYGYATNQIIKFPEVSTIVTELNSAQYPGSSTRFQFLSGDASLMLIYYGHEDSKGNFVFARTENGKPKPNFYIPISSIYAIRAVSPINWSEPYKIGKAV